MKNEEKAVQQGGGFRWGTNNRSPNPIQIGEYFFLLPSTTVHNPSTGIEVQEVVNFVFFKAAYSKIKFWQMIGLGTRLSLDLFIPDQDKETFRIFDFCFNSALFEENRQIAKFS